MTFSASDIQRIREDFPSLAQQVNGYPLVYLDNGATAQKPAAVIDSMTNYYSTINANIHRGVHTLSQRSTEAFEAARVTVQKHINATKPCEIIFTAGTTHAINMLALSFGKKYVRKGSRILLSVMEHHSNILPWQQLCEAQGAVIEVIPMDDDGNLLMDAYENMLNEQVALVAITHISNTLGTVNPVKKMTALAHKFGIPVLIDGAQAIAHEHVDVQDLDVDFYCFGAHKVYGPTGTGVLYGKKKMLEELPVAETGGGTIVAVSFENTIYADLPQKFEAGTPNIAGVIGMAAAFNYLQPIGMDAIKTYESSLLLDLQLRLQEIPGLRLIGRPTHRASVISFLIDGLHPFDVGTILNQYGIAVRTGHHCTQPLMQRLNVPGTIRVSPALYNTFDENDKFITGLQKAIKLLQ